MGRFLSTQLSVPSNSVPFSFENLEEEPIPTHLFLEKLTKLMEKWPKDFEQDLFKSYQQYLALTEKEFRTYRSIQHQLRIICYHYLMRKALLCRKQVVNKELDVELRLLPTCLHFPFGQKAVLGIAIAIHLSSSYERFEDTHILSAVRKLLPETQAIKESFLAFQKPCDLSRLLYLEVEKTRDSFFSATEIALLKQRLLDELKKHVEKLSPSIFGNHEVEETMRNIISLSQELQFPSDLPQIVISFEHALANALVFRVIVVRPVNKKSLTLAESFQQLSEPFEYILERSSVISRFSSDYEAIKEASVFRLQIPKQPFLLRSDSSFNFYRARDYVLSLITQALGDVRDYNGGIFSKQLELFAQFKRRFRKIEENDPELLEDFFYALRPLEMQAIISISSLAQFFELFLQAREEKLPKKESVVLRTHEEEGAIFAILRFRDPALQEYLNKAVYNNQLSLWLNIKDPESITLGYVYQTSSREKQKKFKQILDENLKLWIEEMQNLQVLHLCPQHLPVSLDPRLGGDEISSVILKLLFEGLMTIGKDGKLSCAIAEKVIFSPDSRHYTFKLRECTWSNGDRVTAHDFCYTWKKILSPHFKSAFAYLFYVILNAKKAKEGLISSDKIGVEALDDLTLDVHLEKPCSYFLELTAHPLFSPVNHRIDRMHPNWPLQTGSAYICNGPFSLEHSTRHENYELRKNSHYWNQSAISLERIQFSRANGREAVEMFKRGETDWIGRPLRAWEPIFSQDIGEPIEKIPFNTSYWYVFNTKQFPFQSRKMRQAFAYAIDRQAIIDFLSHQATPAFTPLPLGHTQFPKLHPRQNHQAAQRLFQEALQELGIDRQSLPPFELIYPNNDLRSKIADLVIEQWENAFGVVIERKSMSFKSLFTKIVRGEYQIGAMSWWPRIDDPLYTLDAFKAREEQINFPKWENKTYQSLLERAYEERSSQKRRYLLAKAESILTREMPVIPLFHEVELFVRQGHVEDIFPSKIGNIDFKYASINKENQKTRRFYG